MSLFDWIKWDLKLLVLFYRNSRLSLAHKEIETAVRQRYLKGGQEEELYLHRLLAGEWSGQLWAGQGRTKEGNQLPIIFQAGQELRSQELFFSVWNQQNNAIYSLFQASWSLYFVEYWQEMQFRVQTAKEITWGVPINGRLLLKGRICS